MVSISGISDEVTAAFNDLKSNKCKFLIAESDEESTSVKLSYRAEADATIEDLRNNIAKD